MPEISGLKAGAGAEASSRSVNFGNLPTWADEIERDRAVDFRGFFNRFDAIERRHPGDDARHGGRGGPACRRKAVGFLGAVRLVDDDIDHILRIIHREYADE